MTINVTHTTIPVSWELKTMDWGFMVSIFLMVVFGIATIVLTIKLTRRKKPVWAYTTKKIIGLGTSAPRNLKLYFRKSSITNVYRTTFVVFNKGEKAIRKEDVTKRITVSFVGAKILEKPSIRPSNKEIRLSAKRVSRGQDSKVELDFSYLDHNDGVIVEVLHTEYKDIKCTGNILEAGEPRYIGEFNPHRPEGFWAAIVMLTLFSAMIVWMWFDAMAGAAQATTDWITFSLLSLFTAIDIYLAIAGIIRLRRYMQFRRWSNL